MNAEPTAHSQEVRHLFFNYLQRGARVVGHELRDVLRNLHAHVEGNRLLPHECAIRHARIKELVECNVVDIIRPRVTCTKLKQRVTTATPDDAGAPKARSFSSWCCASSSVVPIATIAARTSSFVSALFPASNSSALDEDSVMLS